MRRVDSAVLSSWASSSASVRRLDFPREPFFLCFALVATEPFGEVKRCLQ